MKNQNKKKWFYIVMVAIPLAFFVLLELTLCVFNYGEDYSTFVVLEEISDQYFLNPKLPNKFFTNTSAVPSVIPEPFDKVKGENTIRVFVFGGSTTAGYPFPPNASFPRQIKRKLEMFYPDYRIEVINLGVSAVNSYFVRDILPDVLSKDPDLLIFYAGHNEFYGALGPASTEYIFSNPTLVQLLLDLRELKTYQLIQNIMGAITSTLAGEAEESRSTLMSELIKEQEIPYDSEIYKAGLNQYRENMDEVLSLCEDQKIPVVFGTLVSNLKQKPLSSSDEVAQSYFESAQSYLESDTLKAHEFFAKAKDYDLLKFRATEDFNKIIVDLRQKYKFDLVEVKKGFEKHSPQGITGFNLMVDHLHPNLDGYKLMANTFFESTDNSLSKKYKKASQVSPEAINNYLDENFPFGRYDSTYSKIKIEVLLNDYPFEKNSDFNLAKFPLENYEDTLAMQTITEGLGMAAARIKIFDHYFDRGDYKKAAKSLFILMEDRPFYKSGLQYGIAKLLSKEKTREAKHILIRNHNRYPDFFTAKNLGVININEGNVKLAEKLLIEADQYQSGDSEVYYNLSKSFYTQKDISNAIIYLEKCMKISPDYPGAKQIYTRLKEISENHQK